MIVKNVFAKFNVEILKAISFLAKISIFENINLFTVNEQQKQKKVLMIKFKSVINVDLPLILNYFQK